MAGTDGVDLAGAGPGNGFGPEADRPWGAITWLAEMYLTSRETIYDIGRQVLLLPGGASLRAIQDCLEVSLDTSRSIGYLCMQALSAFEHPKIKEWLTYINNQYDQLFTYLDWLEVSLDAWHQQAVRHLRPSDVPFLERLTARAWRLQRAVVNGHRAFGPASQRALALLDAFIADDPAWRSLAQSLMTILEQTIRTSCAAETVNSIIKPYLRTKPSQPTLFQYAWLNKRSVPFFLPSCRSSILICQGTLRLYSTLSEPYSCWASTRRLTPTGTAPTLRRICSTIPLSARRSSHQTCHPLAVGVL